MSPHRILLVDDEDDVREVARLSLELGRGWTVRAVRSGEEALRAAEEETPDAVLLDVMMPDVDGPETLRRLRVLPGMRDVPAVLLTARRRPERLAAFDGLGVVGAIPKPFDPLTLADRVEEVLGWSR